MRKVKGAVKGISSRVALRHPGSGAGPRITSSRAGVHFSLLLSNSSWTAVVILQPGQRYHRSLDCDRILLKFNSKMRRNDTQVGTPSRMTSDVANASGSHIGNRFRYTEAHGPHADGRQILMAV